MKPKHIVLIIVVGFSCLLAYSHYQLSRSFRFPGERGKIYETWETTNNNFKVKITAYYEVGIYMPGAFFVCESASVSSNEWREFKAFRGDDPVPISYLNERFRFINDQTAYLYTADDFSVTLNGGRNWSVWKPLLPQRDGKLVFWAFIGSACRSRRNRASKTCTL